MGKKKLSRKQIQDPKNKPTQMKGTPDARVSDKLKIYLGIIIAVFSFVLYASSIQDDFTLDDSSVVHENSITKKGLSGLSTIITTDYWYGAGHNTSRGPIYRPTSLVIFAVVWQFSPNNPHAYHFVNVIFYALTCLLLFAALCKLFKTQNLLFPFVCALLYAAHPIHTEVVNNIKSLDEILCFLFGIIAIWFILKHISAGSKSSFVLGGVSFFLSLISKETAIAFLVIIPLVIFFSVDGSVKKLFTTFIFLLVITGIWLIIRAIVFRDLPSNTANTASALNNTLNAAPDNISKYATAFYILLRYIGLLFFPHPLSYDYSFSQIKIQSASDPAALFAVILFFALTIYSIIYIRKKNIIAFGILFFLVSLAPVSNLFFLVASTMAERFLYIPSLGFCIVLTYFLISLTKTESVKTRFKNLLQFFSFNQLLFLIVLVICSLYCYKTISRNKDWKDNLTLFTHDVKISSNSARANQILGSALMMSVLKSTNKKDQSDTFTLAKKYLKRALEIYPEYYAPLSHLGVIYMFENKIDSAYVCLKKGIEMMPNDVDLSFNYGLALFHLKRYEEAIKALNHTIELSPQHENAYYNLAALHQNTHNYDQALFYYSKVIELNPNSAGAYYQSGVILKSKGDTARAREFMDKAAALGYNTN